MSETLEEAQARARIVLDDNPMSRHYLRGLRENEYKIDGGYFHCLTRGCFKDIALYQTSTPTGPSPGRIYKRHYTEDGWIIFICVNDDEDPRMVKHVPFKCVVEPEIEREAIVGRFTE